MRRTDARGCVPSQSVELSASCLPNARVGQQASHYSMNGADQMLCIALRSETRSRVRAKEIAREIFLANCRFRFFHFERF
jgi:hypothetical protein